MPSSRSETRRQKLFDRWSNGEITKSEYDRLMAELARLEAESAPKQIYAPDAAARESATVAGIPIPPALKPGTLLDKYELKSSKRGGMGEVWKAWDAKADRWVAVKLLPQELRGNVEEIARIRSQFKLVEQLDHPHICRLFDLNEHPVWGWYEVMRWIDGETLAEIAANAGGKLPYERVVRLLWPVARALDHAHARNVLHRDIKPQNIMEDGQGKVLVIDFGLAAEIKGSVSRVSKQINNLSGTPHYLAPELWNEAPESSRSDQYALAVTAYELLSGRKPFDSDNIAILMTRTQSAEVPALSGVDDEAMTILQRALSKSPQTRFETCSEFIKSMANPSKSAKELRTTEITAPENLEASSTPKDTKTSSPDGHASEKPRSRRKKPSDDYTAIPAPVTQPEVAVLSFAGFVKQNRATLGIGAAVIGLVGIGLLARTVSTRPLNQELASSVTPQSSRHTPTEQQQPNQQAQLGIDVESLPEVNAKWMKVAGGGVIINSILPGSAAEQGGLEIGDVLVQFDDKLIQRMEDFTPLTIAAMGVGSKHAVTILRDGQRKTLLVVLKPQKNAENETHPLKFNELSRVALGPVIQAIGFAGPQLCCATNGGVGVWRISDDGPHPVFWTDGIAIDLSAEGTTAVVAEKFGGLATWNTLSGKKKLILSENGDEELKACRLDSSGQRIATIHERCKLRLWDAVAGKKIDEIELTPEGRKHGLSTFINCDLGPFSPSGNFILLKSTSEVFVWNILNRTIDWSWKADAPITGFSPCPDWSRCAVAIKSGAVKILSLQDTSVIATLRGHEEYAEGLSWHGTDLLASASPGDRTVRVWSVGNQSTIWQFDTEEDVKSFSLGPSAVCFQPDQPRLWTGVVMLRQYGIPPLSKDSWQIPTEKDEAIDFSSMIKENRLSISSSLTSTSANNRVTTTYLFEDNSSAEGEKPDENSPWQLQFIDRDGKTLLDGCCGFAVDADCVVTTIVPESSASAAGIVKGDMVLAWGDSAKGPFYRIPNGSTELAQVLRLRLFAGRSNSTVWLRVKRTSGTIHTVVVERDQPHSTPSLAPKRTTESASIPSGPKPAAMDKESVLPLPANATSQARDLRSGWEFVTSLQKIGASESVYGLALSPSGTLLATGDAGQVLRLWDIDKGEIRKEIRNHRPAASEVQSPVFFNDGKRFLFAFGRHRVVELWAIDKVKPLALFEKDANEETFAVALSPSEKVFAAAGKSGIVTLRSVLDGRSVKRIDHGLSGIISPSFIAFSADGKRIACATETSREIAICDCTSGAKVHSLNGHESQISGVSYGRKGNVLVSADRDGAIQIWSASSGKQLRRGLTDNLSIKSLALSSDERFIATGNSDGTVAIWDSDSVSRIQNLQPSFEGNVDYVTFSRDGRRIAAVAKGRCGVWQAVPN